MFYKYSPDPTKKCCGDVSSNIFLIFTKCFRAYWGYVTCIQFLPCATAHQGGGPRVVVSTAAFHCSGFVSRSRRFERNKLVELSIVGSLRGRKVACSASDRQGLNFESCIWRAVSSHSSHHPQEAPLVQI